MINNENTNEMTDMKPTPIGRFTGTPSYEELQQKVARLRLTDEEREAIKRAIDSQQDRAAEMHSRSWNAAAIDKDCDTLRGMLERLG
jgi:hypothetical protein